MQLSYNQHSEFSFIHQQTRVPDFINIPKISKLNGNNKQENSMHKNFKNCYFIRKREKLHYVIYRTKRMIKKRRERMRDRKSYLFFLCDRDLKGLMFTASNS